MGCVSDAPGIAIHNASALEGVDVATADQYRVAAIRMANLARVVRALESGVRLAGWVYA